MCLNKAIALKFSCGMNSLQPREGAESSELRRQLTQAAVAVTMQILQQI